MCLSASHLSMEVLQWRRLSLALLVSVNTPIHVIFFPWLFLVLSVWYSAWRRTVNFLEWYTEEKKSAHNTTRSTEKISSCGGNIWAVSSWGPGPWDCCLLCHKVTHDHAANNLTQFHPRRFPPARIFDFSPHTFCTGRFLHDKNCPFHQKAICFNEKKIIDTASGIGHAFQLLEWRDW